MPFRPYARRSTFREVVAALIFFALFGGWLIASNFGDSAFAGTWTYRDSNLKATLTLQANRTFHEELIQDGNRKIADGKWRPVGEAGVVFELPFVPLPGMQAAEEAMRRPEDGPSKDQYYGELQRFLWVYPYLELHAQPRNIILHWQPFH